MLYKEEKKLSGKNFWTKEYRNPNWNLTLGQCWSAFEQLDPELLLELQQKPLLSKPPINQTLSIKQTLSQVPKLSFYF